MGGPLHFVFLIWEIIEVICHTAPNFAVANLVFWRVSITCLIGMTREQRKFYLFLCVGVRVIISWQVSGMFRFKILLSHHGHNVLGDGLGVNLESCVSVTNLAEFKICLVHEVLGIGDFTIFNIINLVSDSLCPGLKLTDVGVGGDDVL